MGQGCATSVGMAIAERWSAKQFNRPGFQMIDHDIYAVCGDGDMMEGVTGEAASLAGHLILGHLCWIYDSNQITIEGHTDIGEPLGSEEVRLAKRAYGWPAIRLSALMELPVITLFTHGSIGLGEDGPTHQPVEQLVALRAVRPGNTIFASGASVTFASTGGAVSSSKAAPKTIRN